MFPRNTKSQGNQQQQLNSDNSPSRYHQYAELQVYLENECWQLASVNVSGTRERDSPIYSVHLPYYCAYKPVGSNPVW